MMHIRVRQTYVHEKWSRPNKGGERLCQVEEGGVDDIPARGRGRFEFRPLPPLGTKLVDWLFFPGVLLYMRHTFWSIGAFAESHSAVYVVVLYCCSHGCV